jgi:hypothetical protein
MAAPAIYVILAPEERNAGTSPQSKSSAQPSHRSHLLHSNQILSYAMSIALGGMWHIGQMSDFLEAVIEEAGTPRRMTPARLVAYGYMPRCSSFTSSKVMRLTRPSRSASTNVRPSEKW